MSKKKKADLLFEIGKGPFYELGRLIGMSITSAAVLKIWESILTQYDLDEAPDLRA